MEYIVKSSGPHKSGHTLQHVGKFGKLTILKPGDAIPDGMFSEEELEKFVLSGSIVPK